MTQFYLSDAYTMRRCQESVADRKAVTVTGETGDGRVAAFTGVVQSVEDQGANKPSRRWRITMPDAKVTLAGNI